MNIQQLKYILAVVEYRHFETAAEKCFVTQSTLSTMINRFEEEINIKIFNRKTKPVSITKEGNKIIEHLRIIIKEVDTLNYISQEIKGKMAGKLQIGVIPTVAPYLLPLFLSDFAQKFPKVKIIVQEMTTENIQKSLKLRIIDIGILATPLEDNELIESCLYSEPFMVYDCNSKNLKNTISIKYLDYSKLWFLEDGHCLRTQVQQICKFSKNKTKKNLNLEFKAGSMESLLRFTKSNKGITILPYLATLDLSKEDKSKLIQFEKPVPVRTIGLITHKYFVKKKILEELKKIILKSTEPLLPNISELEVIKPL